MRALAAVVAFLVLVCVGSVAKTEAGGVGILGVIVKTESGMFSLRKSFVNKANIYNQIVLSGAYTSETDRITAILSKLRLFEFQGYIIETGPANRWKYDERIFVSRNIFALGSECINSIHCSVFALRKPLAGRNRGDGRNDFSVCSRLFSKIFVHNACGDCLSACYCTGNTGLSWTHPSPAVFYGGGLSVIMLNFTCVPSILQSDEENNVTSQSSDEGGENKTYCNVVSPSASTILFFVFFGAAFYFISYSSNRLNYWPLPIAFLLMLAGTALLLYGWGIIASLEPVHFVPLVTE